MADKRLDIIIAGKDRASKVLKRVGASVGRLARGIGTVGAVAGTAAVAGLAVMTKQSLDAIDATGKLAARIGDTTEAIIGLRHAAELSGAGAELMDKSLDVMAKRLGEAAQGSGQAKDAIEQLGLDVNKLVQMRPSEAFKTIAEAMKGLTSQSERAAVASDIFSRQGLKLVNTLAMGRDGLEEATAEMKLFGRTFSNVDAAQVEAANDAMYRLKELTGGIGDQLAVQLAPLLEDVSKRLVAMGTSGEGMGAKVGAALEKVVGGMAMLADFLEMPKAAFYSLRGVAVGALAVIATAVVDVMDKVARLLDMLPYVEASVSRSGEAVAASLRDSAAEAFAQAEAAHEAFHSGANSRRVETYFADLRDKSREAAEATVNAQDDGGGGLFGSAMEGIRGFASGAAAQVQAGASALYANVEASFKRIGEISRELEIERMKAAGNRLGVALAQVADTVEDRLAKARTVQEKELIRQIGEIQVENIRKQFAPEPEKDTPGTTERASRVSLNPTLLSNRFVGIANRFGAGDEPGKRTARHTKTIADEVKNQGRLLKELIRQNRKGGNTFQVINSY